MRRKSKGSAAPRYDQVGFHSSNQMETFDSADDEPPITHSTVEVSTFVHSQYPYEMDEEDSQTNNENTCMPNRYTSRRPSWSNFIGDSQQPRFLNCHSENEMSNHLGDVSTYDNGSRDWNVTTYSAQSIKYLNMGNWEFEKPRQKISIIFSISLCSLYFGFCCWAWSKMRSSSTCSGQVVENTTCPSLGAIALASGTKFLWLQQCRELTALNEVLELSPVLQPHDFATYVFRGINTTGNNLPPFQTAFDQRFGCFDRETQTIMFFSVLLFFLVLRCLGLLGEKYHEFQFQRYMKLVYNATFSVLLEFKVNSSSKYPKLQDYIRKNSQAGISEKDPKSDLNKVKAIIEKTIFSENEIPNHCSQVKNNREQVYQDRAQIERHFRRNEAKIKKLKAEVEKRILESLEHADEKNRRNSVEQDSSHSVKLEFRESVSARSSLISRSARLEQEKNNKNDIPIKRSLAVMEHVRSMESSDTVFLIQRVKKQGYRSFNQMRGFFRNSPSPEKSENDEEFPMLSNEEKECLTKIFAGTLIKNECRAYCLSIFAFVVVLYSLAMGVVLLIQLKRDSNPPENIENACDRLSSSTGYSSASLAGTCVSWENMSSILRAIEESNEAHGGPAYILSVLDDVFNNTYTTQWGRMAAQMQLCEAKTTLPKYVFMVLWSPVVFLFGMIAWFLFYCYSRSSIRWKFTPEFIKYGLKNARKNLIFWYTQLFDNLLILTKSLFSRSVFLFQVLRELLRGGTEGKSRTQADRENLSVTCRSRGSRCDSKAPLYGLWNILWWNDLKGGDTASSSRSMKTGSSRRSTWKGSCARLSSARSTQHQTVMAIDTLESDMLTNSSTGELTCLDRVLRCKRQKKDMQSERQSAASFASESSVSTLQRSDSTEACFRLRMIAYKGMRFIEKFVIIALDLSTFVLSVLIEVSISCLGGISGLFVATALYSIVGLTGFVIIGVELVIIGFLLLLYLLKLSLVRVCWSTWKNLLFYLPGHCDQCARLHRYRFWKWCLQHYCRKHRFHADIVPPYELICPGCEGEPGTLCDCGWVLKNCSRCYCEAHNREKDYDPDAKPCCMICLYSINQSKSKNIDGFEDVEDMSEADNNVRNPLNCGGICQIGCQHWIGGTKTCLVCTSPCPKHMQKAKVECTECWCSVHMQQRQEGVEEDGKTLRGCRKCYCDVNHGSQIRLDEEGHCPMCCCEHQSKKRNCMLCWCNEHDYPKSHDPCETCSDYLETGSIHYGKQCIHCQHGCASCKAENASQTRWEEECQQHWCKTHRRSDLGGRDKEEDSKCIVCRDPCRECQREGEDPILLLPRTMCRKHWCIEHQREKLEACQGQCEVCEGGGCPYHQVDALQRYPTRFECFELGIHWCYDSQHRSTKTDMSIYQDGGIDLTQDSLSCPVCADPCEMCPFGKKQNSMTCSFKHKCLFHNEYKLSGKCSACEDPCPDCIQLVEQDTNAEVDAVNKVPQRIKCHQHFCSLHSRAVNLGRVGNLKRNDGKCLLCTDACLCPGHENRVIFDCEDCYCIKHEMRLCELRPSCAGGFCSLCACAYCGHSFLEGETADSRGRCRFCANWCQHRMERTSCEICWCSLHNLIRVPDTGHEDEEFNYDGTPWPCHDCKYCIHDTPRSEPCRYCKCPHCDYEFHEDEGPTESDRCSICKGWCRHDRDPQECDICWCWDHDEKRIPATGSDDLDFDDNGTLWPCHSCLYCQHDMLRTEHCRYCKCPHCGHAFNTGEGPTENDRCSLCQNWCRHDIPLEGCEYCWCKLHGKRRQATQEATENNLDENGDYWPCFDCSHCEHGRWLTDQCGECTCIQHPGSIKLPLVQTFTPTSNRNRLLIRLCTCCNFIPVPLTRTRLCKFAAKLHNCLGEKNHFNKVSGSVPSKLEEMETFGLPGTSMAINHTEWKPEHRLHWREIWDQVTSFESGGWHRNFFTGQRGGSVRRLSGRERRSLCALKAAIHFIADGGCKVVSTGDGVIVTRIIEEEAGSRSHEKWFPWVSRSDVDQEFYYPSENVIGEKLNLHKAFAPPIGYRAWGESDSGLCDHGAVGSSEGYAKQWWPQNPEESFLDHEPLADIVYGNDLKELAMVAQRVNTDNRFKYSRCLYSIEAYTHEHQEAEEADIEGVPIQDLLLPLGQDGQTVHLLPHEDVEKLRDMFEMPDLRVDESIAGWPAQNVRTPDFYGREELANRYDTVRAELRVHSMQRLRQRNGHRDAEYDISRSIS